MDQITESRLHDIPRGVYWAAATLTIIGVGLVIWPAVWWVRRGRGWL